MYRKIGCRAHDYGKNSIEALCEMMKKDGYETTQLALKKALEDVKDLPEKLTNDYGASLKKVMDKYGVDVSVFGAYLNYAHPDDATRDGNIDILRGHLRMANSLGARMVGTETGSLDENYNAHVDNHGEYAFQRFKTAIESVMPIAEEESTYMAVEAVAHHIIHTPERMHRLIKEIGHPRLKVIFDINNLITEKNWNEQECMINQMFDLLEDRIMAIHIKDFDFLDGEKVIVPLGSGKLKVETLLKRAIKSSQSVDLLAENVQRDLLTQTNIVLKKAVDDCL